MAEIVDDKLLKVLVCPDDKGALFEDLEAHKLACSVCGKRYSLTESGIPILMGRKSKTEDSA